MEAFQINSALFQHYEDLLERQYATLQTAPSLEYSRLVKEVAAIDAWLKGLGLAFVLVHEKPNSDGVLHLRALQEQEKESISAFTTEQLPKNQPRAVKSNTSFPARGPA